MIYLKLRQWGMVVDHKRVERLYTEAHMQAHSLAQHVFVQIQIPCHLRY